MKLLKFYIILQLLYNHYYSIVFKVISLKAVLYIYIYILIDAIILNKKSLRHTHTHTRARARVCVCIYIYIYNKKVRKISRY